MAKGSPNNSDKQLEYLFKKWELYWNHYKLQHEAYERRRYLIWLIHSALAVAWYKTFYDCHTFMAFVVSLFATIFSFLWFFMCKRERESIFFTEEQLRETEKKINMGIEFNYFTLRKIIFGPEPQEDNLKDKDLREKFQKEKVSYWKFNKDIDCINNKLDNLYCNSKIKSVKFLLDFFLPLAFSIIWMIIIIYTISNASIMTIVTLIITPVP